MEVTATKTVEKDGKKVRDTSKAVNVNVDIPGDLAGLEEKFGAEVVAAAAIDSLVITVQALMRRLMAKGKSTAEIQAEVDKWKPEVRTLVKQSAFEKASNAISKMSAEERAELLKKLQAAG